MLIPPLRLEAIFPISFKTESETLAEVIFATGDGIMKNSKSKIRKWNILGICKKTNFIAADFEVVDGKGKKSTSVVSQIRESFFELTELHDLDASPTSFQNVDFGYMGNILQMQNYSSEEEMRNMIDTSIPKG